MNFKKLIWAVLFVLCCSIGSIILQNLKYDDEVYYLHDKNKKQHPFFSNDYFNKICDADTVKEFYLNFNIKGIVIGKYYVRQSHNEPLIWIEDSIYYYNLRTRGFDEYGTILYKNIKVGDSIFKNSGSMIVSLKRGKFIKNFWLMNYWDHMNNPYYQENTDTLR
jgi:hypothetical protein